MRNRGLWSSRGKEQLDEEEQQVKVHQGEKHVAGEKSSRARSSRVRSSRVRRIKVRNRGLWSSRGKDWMRRSSV